MVTLIIFIVILGLLVFVHELGHFVMAKRSGMAVEEFGFGFPPRLFGIKKGETIYSINWIPLGGFVKIVGEDGGDAANPKSFGSKSFGARLAVLAAGVTMNVIFAWVLISIGLAAGLPTALDEGETLPGTAKIRDVSVAVIEVAPESPASAADFKVGDRIIKINGQEVTSIDTVQNLTQENIDKPTTYTFERGSTVLEKQVVPRGNPPADQGPLGIGLSSVGLVSYPWYVAPWKGLQATIGLIWATLSAFWTILSNLVGGAPAGVDLTGPVGIAKLTGDVAALGFVYLLQFTAILSVNLAIINAVPFPALDGGRILFLIIEKIRRKKMSVNVEQWANTVGFTLLLLLMFFVTVKDVGRFQLITKIKDLF
ncbi:MAG TPA: RIP metalloprotease RseP [Verrucomicrobiae bacterium]|nr:RIP metalloprotease RseP [Verrucomicrobiae bacterium]